MSVKNVRELVIELPKSDPELRRLPAGHQVRLFEHRLGSPLEQVMGVTAMTLRVTTWDLMTADLTFDDGTSTTWLVADIRERQ